MSVYAEIILCYPTLREEYILDREKVIFPKENEDVDRLLLFLLSTMSTLQVVKISIFVFVFERFMKTIFIRALCVVEK